MLGRSHLVVGLAAYVLAWGGATEVLGVALPVIHGTTVPVGWSLPLSLAIVGVGALAPDIDHPDSTFARGWRAPSGIEPLRGVSWLIRLVFGHRGITHAVWFLGLIGWWVEHVARTQFGIAGLGGCLAFGFATHLLADAMTRAGVPLFWPLRYHVGLPPVRALRIRSGDRTEQLIVVALVVLAVVKVTTGVPG